VIAEEVGQVVPEVVTFEANGKDAQGVDYSRLTAVLIGAVKEQQRQIQEQQRQIRTQQRQIARLNIKVGVLAASLRTSKARTTAKRGGLSPSHAQSDPQSHPLRSGEVATLAIVSRRRSRNGPELEIALASGIGPEGPGGPAGPQVQPGQREGLAFTYLTPLRRLPAFQL
jgi:hypothetical protein